MKTITSPIQRVFVITCLAMLLSATVQAQIVLKDDFRINEETIFTTVGQQITADIASSPGGFTAVWLDETFPNAVYAQRFDTTGIASGTVFKVSEDITGVFVGRPRVARHFPQGVIGDVAGTTVVVWADARQDPMGDIYAQRYDNTNEVPLGPNFRINEDAPDGGQRDPAVDMCPAPVLFRGRYVVVWTDWRNGEPDVYASFSGSPGFSVIDDTTRAPQDMPDVAAACDGGFIAVWRDGRTTGRGPGIYAQRVGFDGVPRGGNFRVDTLVTGASLPRVVVDKDGSFVITYMGQRGGSRQVYARRYTDAGVPDGEPVNVNDSPVSIISFPTANFLLSGSIKNGYIVAWETDSDIYMQCIDSQGRRVGNNTVVSLPAASNQFRPAIAALGYRNTVPPLTRSMMVWDDDRIGDHDIWAQTVEGACNMVGSNYLVNGRTVGGANQIVSALETTTKGSSVVVWQDDRDVAAGWDLYGKRLNERGDPLSPDVKINDDAGSADQIEPDIAMHPDSSYVVVWTDFRRDPDGDIFAQRFEAGGLPVGPNVVVNDTLVAGRQSAPSVAMRPGGGYLVAWVDTRDESEGEIFAQWFDAQGNPTGSDVRVNPNNPGIRHSDPAVAVMASGESVITWADDRIGTLDIWAQRYRADGGSLSSDFRVNADTSNHQLLPAVAVAPGGVYLIAWIDFRKSPDGDIFAQRYESTGVSLSGNVQVNDVDNVANPFFFEIPTGPPSVAVVPATPATVQDNTFVVAWTDFRNGIMDPDIYAQRYNSSGDPFEANFRVDAAPGETWQSQPDVARDTDFLYGLFFSWTDERALAAEGRSIWGKIFEWERPTIREPSEVDLPEQFALAQNYPNPFNPTTTIPFEVQTPSRIVLKVFTVMGRHVATLVDGAYAPGYYQATFDAGGLSSGLYFYRIEAGDFHAIKTMVLMK